MNAAGILESLDRLSADGKLPYPGRLEYHLSEHTIGNEGVARRAKHYAVQEGLSMREQELACIAAVFHDTGFGGPKGRYDNNEPVGAEYAKDFMKEQRDGSGNAEYTKQEMRIVEAAIMSTAASRDYESAMVKLQNVDGEMERLKKEGFGGNAIESARRIANVVCDADLDNLGRKDFFELGAKVRNEIGSVKNVQMPNRLAELKSLLSIFEKHGGYKTESARRERGRQYQNNMDEIVASIKKLEGRRVF